MTPRNNQKKKTVTDQLKKIPRVGSVGKSISWQKKQVKRYVNFYEIFGGEQTTNKKRMSQ